MLGGGGRALAVAPSGLRAVIGSNTGGAVIRLSLFGTQGCHLCELAASLVAAAASEWVAWRVVEIADDAALLDRYGQQIPVLRDESDGVELHWPFDASDVERLLTSRSQRRDAGRSALQQSTN